MSSPKSVASLDEADEIYELMAALDLNTDLHGQHDPQTLAAASQLAIAFWHAGEIERAISLLAEVLDRLNSDFAPEHPMRVDVLSTLAEILFEQRYLEQAGAVQREVLEWRIRHFGPNHPNSLEAKGDLAAVLFELGEDEEAARLEQEAFESARAHLNKTHPVASVLAWNRALTYERLQDQDAAKGILISELVWLLAEDPAGLEASQNTVRMLVSKRLNWDAARAC
jgi:tetratricopeptide (TPR) repeat protein